MSNETPAEVLADISIKPTITREEAQACQRWAGMDGAIAWHLIERHAENWADVGLMMDAWLEANRSLAAGKVAPVAWILTRTSDPTFPRVYMSEGEADRMMATNNLPPFCKKHPVYTAPPADPAKASEPDLHPKTADLVNRFARALAEKLSAAEKKYGYSDGWSSPDWMDECRAHLVEHVAKGDPRDVAAYCAFLWHHGSHTNPRSPFCEKCGSAEACDCTTTAKASGSEPEYDRSLIADMLEDASDDTYSLEAIAEQIRLLRAADNADAAKVRTVRSSGSAPDEIDTESADFKEGFAVGRAESEHLCEMIKNPTCHRCGATSAKDAETKCRPGGMGGDECPGTEWPLSKLWASAPEVTGSMVERACIDWYGADDWKLAGPQTKYSVRTGMRAALTAALQEGKSHDQ